MAISPDMGPVDDKHPCPISLRNYTNKISRIGHRFIRFAESYRFRTLLWLYLSLVVFLVPLASCTSRSAQANGDKFRALSKLGPGLAALYNEYSAVLASDKAGDFRSADPFVRVIEDRVLIDAVASDDVNVLKADLVSLGMQEAIAFGRIVSGQLPILAIPAMAALPSLNFARAASTMLQKDR